MWTVSMLPTVCSIAKKVIKYLYMQENEEYVSVYTI